MRIQTPPAVSDDQLAKWVQLTRDRLRKGKLDGPTFQHILGHPTLADQLDKIFSDTAAEYRQSLPLIERLPFLTVRVGTFKTEPELRQAVLDSGCKIGDWAIDLMNQPAFTAGIPQVEEDIDFVYASNEEFGYPNGCTQIQSYEAGLKLGWKPCLPSDGPEIRRHYLDQPDGEWDLVAMEPIADSSGLLKVFDVARGEDGLWLHSSGGPVDFWRGSSRWVFRRK